MRTRREIMKAALAGGAFAANLTGWATAWAQEQPFKPEPGAKLQFLRWGKFLDAEDQATKANIAAFNKATGVEVTITSESMDDIQAKVAVAANVGSGADVVWALHTTPHLFADKLIDISDVADYAGSKAGGWYPLIEQYGKSNGRWIGISPVVIGVFPVYRMSMVKAAGFDRFPTDTDGFLKLCQALKTNKTPAGFTFGKAPSDGNSFCHWLLWSHGASVTDEAGKVSLDSPSTIRALEYARALYDTFIEGTISWSDASNNQAFLADKISLTNNSVSILGKARADKLPMADDIDHAVWPVGSAGKPTELHLVYPMMAFKHTKYPNAAKAFLAFLLERAQYEKLLESSAGYVSQSLKAYETSPVWQKDPKIAAFKDAAARGLPVSYPAPVTFAAASVLADFVVIDMFSQVVSGQATPKDAAARAAKLAQHHYRA
jgi:multiple sugar transport system substrate-binding protein